MLVPANKYRRPAIINEVAAISARGYLGPIYSQPEFKPDEAR
jgi:hypothetical protein